MPWSALLVVGLSGPAVAQEPVSRQAVREGVGNGLEPGTYRLAEVAVKVAKSYQGWDHARGSDNPPDPRILVRVDGVLVHVCRESGYSARCELDQRVQVTGDTAIELVVTDVDRVHDAFIGEASLSRLTTLGATDAELAMEVSGGLQSAHVRLEKYGLLDRLKSRGDDPSTSRPEPGAADHGTTHEHDQDVAESPGLTPGTFELAALDVTVREHNADGKAWDRGAPIPDLQVEVYVSGKFVHSCKVRDRLRIDCQPEIDIQVTSDTIIELWVEDVDLASNDPVGSARLTGLTRDGRVDVDLPMQVSGQILTANVRLQEGRSNWQLAIWVMLSLVGLGVVITVVAQASRTLRTRHAEPREQRFERWLLGIARHLSDENLSCRLLYEDRRLGDFMVLSLITDRELVELHVHRHGSGGARLILVGESRAALGRVSRDFAALHHEVHRRHNGKRRFVHRIRRMVENARKTCEARAEHFPHEDFLRLQGWLDHGVAMIGVEALFHAQDHEDGAVQESDPALRRYPSRYGARISTASGPRAALYAGGGFLLGGVVITEQNCDQLGERVESRPIDGDTGAADDGGTSAGDVVDVAGNAVDVAVDGVGAVAEVAESVVAAHDLLHAVNGVELDYSGAPSLGSADAAAECGGGDFGSCDAPDCDAFDVPDCGGSGCDVPDCGGSGCDVPDCGGGGCDF